MKKTGGHGHTAKHSSSKHAGASKHHPKVKARRATAASATVHAVAKKPAAAKARGWSPDSDVACCSARAVAEAIRIVSGRLVSDDDVLGLYWSVATDGDAGISILDALTAAQRWRVQDERHRQRVVRVPAPFAHDLLGGPGDDGGSQAGDLIRLGLGCHSLILGLDLPDSQPHAVAVDADGAWWSWGQPYAPQDFPGAVIEEAWAVRWL